MIRRVSIAHSLLYYYMCICIYIYIRIYFYFKSLFFLEQVRHLENQQSSFLGLTLNAAPVPPACCQPIPPDDNGSQRK